MDTNAKHVKVLEEILPEACIDGECDHDGDCPPVLMEVCSDCQIEYDEGDMVLLTRWAEAEAKGHVMEPIA